MIIAMGASALMAIAVYATGAWTTFPGCDEMVLADWPANWAVRGIGEGYVWPCTYNLVFPCMLAFWFKMFGVSHAVNVSLTVSAALLASWYALYALNRRGLVVSFSSRLLFLSLFWLPGILPQVYANGRLDTCTLLFTVMFVDALLPDRTVTGRKAELRTAVSALLLMLTSVYMLPVLFVLGLVLLAVASDRRAVFRRGLITAAACAFGYLVMLGFYAWDRELIRFGGFYLFFNTITGECRTPLAERIVLAYEHCPVAIAVSAFTLGVAALKRKWRVLPLVFAIAAVPLVMTLGGRFESYYSWAFQIPAAALLAFVLGESRWRWPAVFLAVISAAGFVWQGAVRYQATESARLRQQAATEFVAAHPEVFRPGEDVVIAGDIYGDGSFYYPALRSGARVWWRGRAMLEAPSDAEKFRAGIAMFVKDPVECEEVYRKVMRWQKTMPVLPVSGIVIHADDASLARDRNLYPASFRHLAF